MMIHDGLWRFMVSEVLWCSMLLFKDLYTIVCDGVWWIIVIHDGCSMMLYGLRLFIVRSWWTMMVRTCLNKVLQSLALLKWCIHMCHGQIYRWAYFALPGARLSDQASEGASATPPSIPWLPVMISTLASWQPKDQLANGQCHPFILVG